MAMVRWLNGIWYEHLPQVKDKWICCSTTPTKSVLLVLLEPCFHQSLWKELVAHFYPYRDLHIWCIFSMKNSNISQTQTYNLLKQPISKNCVLPDWNNPNNICTQFQNTHFSKISHKCKIILSVTSYYHTTGHAGAKDRQGSSWRACED